MLGKSIPNFPAALALFNGYQFASLYVEAAFGQRFPFVKTAVAKGAIVAAAALRRSPEFDDVAQCGLAYSGAVRQADTES